MGLISSMIAGAAMEGGKAGEQVGDEMLRGSIIENLKRHEAEIQANRDARMRENALELAGVQSSQRQAEYAARTPVDVEKARQMLPVEAEKSNAEADQKIRVATESRPKEQEDYYGAAANRLNAEADAIRNGDKYVARGGGKPVLPNIKVQKDEDGNSYMVDQNSGAIGMIRPGEPAREGRSNWFSPDEPATKAVPPTIDWNLNGRSVQLESLYPSIAGRIGDQGAPSGARPPLSAFDLNAKAKTPSPAAIDYLRKHPEAADSFKQHYGVDPQAYLGNGEAGQQTPGFKLTPVDIEAAMADPSAYDGLAKTVGGKATLDAIISDYSRTEQRKTAQPRGRGPIEPNTASAPGAATPEELGQRVDQLKIPYEEAKSRLRTFGQIQIRANPSGYAKAKQDLEQAKEPFERALDAYQRALGAGGMPVTGRSLY